MKALRINDRRLLAAATVIVLVALERATAWITGSQGWLGELGGGVALLAFGLGHCDGLDGPVVSLARRALNDSNVNLVLPWVREQDEAEIREAFTHAVAVRKLGGEARALADQHFFETLVRVHRAGEGAPYTGLKPAGTVEPAVAAADTAILTGKLQPLGQLIVERMEKGLHGHFDAVIAKKKYRPDDVEAGRAYSSAYVEFVHYAERLYDAAETLAPAHAANAPSHTL
jgi:hypothetical protein